MNKDEFNPQWVAGARKRDQSAITNLYNYCYQSVYLTTKSLIKSDEDTVLDILQDSFLKALTSLDQLGDDEKFPVWIKAIARNKSLDWLRKNQKISFQSIDAANEDGIDLQFEDDHIEFMPEIQIDQKETARLIREILNSLSDGQRMAIGMYYYQDMSIKEIAQAVGCSVGTIKAQLHTGRKKIEEKVRELEKNGTKLYGLMPFPFFGLLLRNMNDVSIQPNTERIANLLNNIGIGAATGQVAQQTAASAAESAARTTASQSTGTQAAHVTAKMAGITASHTAKGKVIAGILAAAVLGGAGGTAFLYSINKDATTNVPRVSESISEPAQDESNVSMPERKPDSNAKFDESAEAYKYILQDMQDNGAVLQYAHTVDLNGDGVEEMFVLFDNSDFRLYEYQDGVAELVDEESYTVGIYGYDWSDRPEIRDVAYADIDEETYQYLSPKMVYAFLLDNETRIGLYDLHCDGDSGERWVYVSYENGLWKSTEYRWEWDENYVDRYYYHDNVLIDEEEYYRVCNFVINGPEDSPEDELNDLLA